MIETQNDEDSSKFHRVFCSSQTFSRSIHACSVRDLESIQDCVVVQVGVGLSVSLVGYADSALLVVSSRSFSDRFGLGGLSLLCMLDQ